MFNYHVIDGFHKNPDVLVRLSIECEYENESRFNEHSLKSKKYPGLRSENLFYLDEDLFNYTCVKILSNYFDLVKNPVMCQVDTCFQKIRRYSDVKESPLNKGWIHRDVNIPDVQIAGIVYLNKEVEENTGTTLYDLKNGCKYPYNDRNIQKLNLYNGLEVNEQLYARDISEKNNLFVEKIAVDNQYNRMLCYDSYQYHGVPSFYRENGDRLTQVFFIKNILPIQENMRGMKIPNLFDENYVTFTSKL